jgi:hypothetical protein
MLCANISKGKRTRLKLHTGLQNGITIQQSGKEGRELTPHRGSSLVKLTVPQLVKKFRTFNGALRFNIVFIPVPILSQINPCHPISSGFILMLSFYLSLYLKSGPFL